MTPKHPLTILFLNENPLPQPFTRSTIPGKELRLRSAIDEVGTIHVISRRGDPGSSTDPITALERKVVIHWLPPWPYYLAGFPLFVAGLYYTFKFRPQLIEAESPIISGPAAVLIGLLTHIPTVIEVRASYEELLSFRFSFIPLKFKQFGLRLVTALTYRHATGLIVNSQTYRQALLAQGFSSTVINPGLQYPPGKLPPRKPQTEHVLGYLGRLVPEKGVALLLQAVAILKTNPHLPRFKVLIAGTGPELISLQTLTTNLHLDTTVSFLGHRENYATLRRFSLLVNPCLVNHPLEMVNAEAALMGVPVVCFGNLGLPETVVHNVTGIKVGPKTAASLAQALEKLLLHPDKLAQLTTNGPAFAQKGYDFMLQVYRLKTLYGKLSLLTA